ncbi:hypothetical protein JCM10212_003579 [Sporobolomyces blumeae]
MAQGQLETIPTSVPGLKIVYDFVSAAEERFLLSHIDRVGGGSGPGVQGANKSWGWKQLSDRRSMYWGGTVLPNSGSLVPAPFPKFMDGEWPDVLDRIAQTGVYDEWSEGKGKGKERGPNHCLVNEYLPGQGILPHTDGPAYLPCTTTLSLGSHTILSLRSKPDHLRGAKPSTDDAHRRDDDAERDGSSRQPRPPSIAPTASTSSRPVPIDKIEVLLPPRSLLVLSSTLYSDYLHGIQPLSHSPIESLKACANWEGWWRWKGEHDEALVKRGKEDRATSGNGREEGNDSRDDEAGKELTEVTGGGVDPPEPNDSTTLEPRSEEDDDDDVEVLNETSPERLERVAAERKLVESGHGWERGKRVSLTCRRVERIRRIKLG